MSSAVPLQHDTPARPRSRWPRLDWRAGEVEASRAHDAELRGVERDYPAVAEKMAAIGPLSTGSG
jgi:nitrate reductase alpha subunit